MFEGLAIKSMKLMNQKFKKYSNVNMTIPVHVVHTSNINYLLSHPVICSKCSPLEW